MRRRIRYRDTPTDTLKEISDHIKDVTGIYPDDSEDSTEDNEE